MTSGSSGAYCSSSTMSFARRSVERQASVARTISLRSSTDRSSADLRANASRLRTIFAARAAATRISSRSTRVCGRSSAPIISSRLPITACSGLFSSCATPATSWPTADSRSLWINCSRRRRSSEMSRSTDTKCVALAARVQQRDDGRRHREGRAVRARARHRAAPGAAAAHRRLDVLRRDRVVRHQIARALGQQLFPRGVHGAAERRVCVTAAAVRRQHEDEILGLLDHQRQQPHRAARLLQLRALGRDARHQQRQHRDDRDRGGQIAEPLNASSGAMRRRP